MTAARRANTAATTSPFASLARSWLVRLLLFTTGTVLPAAEATLLVSAPFSPRPRARSADAPLFHLMSPAETGVRVENNYDDPRMWGERSRGFFYGPLGTGVAIADYDADGRADVFIVSKVEGHRLFHNLGDWRFEDVTERLGLASPPPREWEQGATWVDVNNDARLDLYVCRSAATNLLYVQQPDGTFREEAAVRGLAVTDDSVMAAFCDYDHDGWLDVYLVTNTLDVNQDPGRPDLLFHNNGDGTFTDVTARAGIGHFPYQGHSATWWDYDNDGWLDLYVANDFSPPDILYRNNRDGTFSADATRALPHTTNSSMGADVGDLNNDGRLDLLVADMEPTTHEKQHRTMAEARSKLNHESADPFVVIQLPRNALFLNTGTGFCLEAAELAGLASTDWTWSVRCEDFDCDGRVDVHVTNGMNREQNNLDLTQRIARTDNLAEQTRLMKSSPVLAEPNLAFRNLGDLTFAPIGAAWGLNQVGVSFGCASGDLDGDGDLDLVYTNYQAGVTMLRNDAPAGHRLIVQLRGTRSNRFGIGATVSIVTAAGTQIRPLTLARGYMSSSEPIAHFGLGDSERVERLTVTWPSGHVQEFSGLPADRRVTITEPDGPPPSATRDRAAEPSTFREISRYAGLSFLAEEEPLDESRLQPLLPRTFNRCGPALAVGDLNGDGTDDIWVAGTTRTAPHALMADRAGNYHPAPVPAAAAPPDVNDGPALIFDAEGNGMPDVLQTAGGFAANPAAYRPRLLTHRGPGNFSLAPAETLPDVDAPIGAACAADFDRDGDLDVFLGARVLPGQFPEAPRSALLRNQGGRFEDVTDLVAPALRTVGMVTSALWTDVDADGWIDLLVACDWGLVACFRNDQHGHLEETSGKLGFAAAGVGLWSALAAADFNGDGRPDYVAGNLGLNSPYHASTTEPIVLLRGASGDGAAPLTIEGYYEGPTLYPRAPRNELGAVLRSVLRRFPRYNDYAKATLSDIVGERWLASATRTTVTELRTGVFLSQPNGTFQFTPLPRVAQIGPLQGLVAGDWDGDGHADLIALQNAHTFNQTIGRMDGGLGVVLRGDGRGGLEPVPTAASGFIAPGEPRALVILDFDGDSWPDLLATRSRSPSLAWQNRGGAGRHMLELRLRGFPGNPTAIGARVTITLADGTTQTLEVAAGASVVSQSTAALFFGYPTASPPRRIHITWPTGEESEADLTGAPRRIVISLPAE